MSHIYLLGFLDSGNITIAKQLAERLQVASTHTTDWIQSKAGTDLVTLHKEKGPDALAQLQREALQTLAQGEPAVITVSDHAPLQELDWEWFRSTGKTVYIQRTAERLYFRLRHDLKQPTLYDVDNKERQVRIEEMLAEREPGYLQADIVVSCTTEEVPDIVNILAPQLSPE